MGALLGLPDCGEGLGFSSHLCTCGECHRLTPSVYRRDGCLAPFMALAVSKFILSVVTSLPLCLLLTALVL